MNSEFATGIIQQLCIEVTKQIPNYEQLENQSTFFVDAENK